MQIHYLVCYKGIRMTSKVRTALISVSDKTGIEDFARGLAKRGVELLSTGGSAQALRNAGLKVRDVSELTGFPEIMDGRVKTLHPKVHGGILARRDVKTHTDAMKKHDIEAIDMVIINLYPFEETVAKGGNFDDCIENIDIGGPSMVRSAAKNHNDVTIITNPARYDDVLKSLDDNKGATTLELRKTLALEAFSLTAQYDTAISTWFAAQLGEETEQVPAVLKIAAPLKTTLRYGENPHQNAALYTNGSTEASICTAVQLQGKELSYNNISDTDAAFDLVSEFDEPAVAIIKHANPCGASTGTDVVDAYRKALACDPVSAYGGILAFNRTFTGEMAAELGKLFAEVIIAPSFDDEAKERLSKKKNLRLLETGSMQDRNSDRMNIKSVGGGFLVQNRDNIVLNTKELTIPTKRKPTDKEMEDLIFAFTVCKHVKSNAIVYAKDGTTVGIGAGQMSRVDSSRIGAWKAKETNTAVESAIGSVFASDAFLPFADGLENAAEHGVTAVIQPGGSIRDEEVIAAADKHNIAMVFTGIRHFNH
jgi:phosphoribosylaminoimidazolecarboxamide formyltransferase/IMP cyclohydrolase